MDMNVRQSTYRHIHHTRLLIRPSHNILVHGNRGNYQDSPTMPLTLPDQPLIPKSFHRDVSIVTLIAWGASMLSQDR